MERAVTASVTQTCKSRPSVSLLAVDRVATRCRRTEQLLDYPISKRTTEDTLVRIRKYGTGSEKYINRVRQEAWMESSRGGSSSGIRLL